MAVFGKALANGIPISAILGKKRIMNLAQETLLALPCGLTELGFAASLAALKKKRINLQKKLVKRGKIIKN